MADQETNTPTSTDGLNIRVSHGNSQQRYIDSENGYNLHVDQYNHSYLIPGAHMDINGVHNGTRVSYEYTDNNTADINLESSWNSLKNIEAFSDTHGDVTIDNFVHTDVNFGDGGDSSVTITGAKRGFINTGDGNDTITIDAQTNGGGWSNSFVIDTDDGDDTLNVTGDKGHTIIEAAMGDGSDSVTLGGNYNNSIVDLGAGDDSFTGGSATDFITTGTGNDTVTTGLGSDTIYIGAGDGHNIITDFTGVGGGGRGERGMVENHDTLVFSANGMTAENMLLNFDGTDTTITFDGLDDFSITLQDFDFTNLDNLPAGDAYNIIFADETSGQDSFDVFNNHGNGQKTIWNNDITTFLNNADNTVRGRDNSNDIINAMAGNDEVFGRSGDDTIRGQSGDDILHGEEGDDRLFGNSGNDTLDAGIGNDYLFGGEGDDLVLAFEGSNELNGGSGDDTYQVSVNAFNLIDDISGLDTLIVEDGNISDILFSNDGTEIYHNGELFVRLANPASIEQISVGDYGPVDYETAMNFASSDGDDHIDASGLGSSVTLSGRSGHDLIIGTNYDDDLIGKSGNDEIHGGDGNDNIYTQLGDDLIFGGAGNDDLRGQDGNDTVYGGADNDTIRGGAGEDVLHGEAGDDKIGGGDGHDEIYGGEGYDKLFGNDGDDLISGDAGDDEVWGLEGDDTLFGGDGNDTIVGGTGNDTLSGGAGSDKINGGDGIDALTFENATEGVDVRLNQNKVKIDGEGGSDDIFFIENVFGSQFDDLLAGDGLDNLLDGSSGNDQIYGLGGNDTLHGGDGNDAIFGHEGNDAVFGDAGHDTIYGGAGDDVLTGGSGVDVLTGGTGADTFAFSADEDSMDRIKDFDISRDFLDISEILTGFDGSNIEDFAQILHTGGRFELSVDRDGGGDNFEAIARVFSNIDDGLSAQDLYDAGTLIADTAIV